MSPCIFFFDPVIEFNIVDRREHSCSVAWEIIEGDIAYGGVYTFIVTGLKHFNDVVIVWLLGFEVDARELGRELGVAIGILDDAPFILQVIITSVVELFLAI
jgi:hypothetical protein